MRSIKPKMNYLRKKRMKNAGDPKGFWGRYTLRGMNRDHQSLVQFGLAEVPVEADATCLDVGCGGGKTLSVLAKEAFRGNVYGVDISKTSVRQSKKLNKKAVRSGQMTIDLADVHALPFDNDAFDLVTAVETFYFWQDKPSALREIARVLKKSGILLVMLDAYDDGVTDYSVLKKEINLELNTPEDVLSMLTAAGFSSATYETRDKSIVFKAIK